MLKILIIEDDIKLRTLMKDSLDRYGYNAICLESFFDIEAAFKKEKPQLVLLDINLPSHDGFYYCRLFRRTSKVPIIIISARSGESQQVMSMELGADDYVVKPFSIELLVAKVQAVIRRVYGEYSVMDSKEIDVCGITLDERNFKIQYKRKILELSKNEFKLIKKFLEKRDNIISREELLTELWDEFKFVDDNTLTVNVTRVKNTLSELGIDDVIKTKRGLGYIFDTSNLKGDRL